MVFEGTKFWKSCLGLSAATKVKLLFDEYIKTLRIFSLPKAIEKKIGASLVNIYVTATP